MQRYAANTPASSDPRKTTPKSFINRMKDRRGSNPSVTSSDFASEETDSKLGDDSKHGGTAFAYSDFEPTATAARGSARPRSTTSSSCCSARRRSTTF